MDQKFFQIRAYPNPFSDKAVVEFVPIETDHVTIELYNNRGVLVKILFEGESEKSQPHSVPVDGAMFVNGTYHFIVKSTNRNVICTRSLILIK